MEGGKGFNIHNNLIHIAYLNLFIAITTDDIQEFYTALGGKKLRDENCSHATWDEANNPKPFNRKRKAYDRRYKSERII